MNVKEAREFLSNPPISRRASHYVAEGYIEALNGPEVKLLHEALYHLAYFASTIEETEEDEHERLAELMVVGQKALDEFREAIEK